MDTTWKRSPVTIRRLEDIEDRSSARRCRFIDTKDWDGYYALPREDYTWRVKAVSTTVA
jgi:hypothetical protein